MITEIGYYLMAQLLNYLKWSCSTVLPAFSLETCYNETSFSFPHFCNKRYHCLLTFLSVTWFKKSEVKDSWSFQAAIESELNHTHGCLGKVHKKGHLFLRKVCPLTFPWPKAEGIRKEHVGKIILRVIALLVSVSYSVTQLMWPTETSIIQR